MGEMERGEKFILGVFTVAILLAIFGVWYDVANAAPSYPPQVNAAISDLGQLMSLPQYHIDSIRYIPQTFKNTALDCKRAGVTALPIAMRGYGVYITYHGVLFVYHVASNIVTLCYVGVDKVQANG